MGQKSAYMGIISAFRCCVTFNVVVMGWIIGIIGIVSCLFVAGACLVIMVGVTIDLLRAFRRPTPREKAEMENTEFDYGHNVKNYTEEDYE